MANKQILAKAIQKAIDGGWKIPDVWGLTVASDSEIEKLAPIFIFNHDFAKALWGENPERESLDGTAMVILENWQYHLQQMVIAEDPIKYLGDNI